MADDWADAGTAPVSTPPQAAGPDAPDSGGDDWVDVGSVKNPASGPGPTDYEKKVASFSDIAPRIASEIYPYNIDVNVPILTPLANKAAAATNALFHAGEKTEAPSFGERYDNNLALFEAVDRARRAKQTGVQKAVEIAANLGTGLALPGGFLGKYLGKGVLAAAGEGALYGGANSALEASPDESTASAAASGAGIGGVLGGTLSAVLSPFAKSAARKAADRTVATSEKNPGRAGLTSQEFLQSAQQGDPVNIADIRGMDKPLNDAAGKVGNKDIVDNLNETLATRASGSAQRTADKIEDVAGKPIDLAQMHDQYWDAAQKANKKAYDDAYNQPAAQQIWDPAPGGDFENFINTTTGLEAVNRAHNWINQKNLANGKSIDPFPFQKVGGWWELKPNAAMPDLQFWDATKQALNSMYRENAPGTSKSALQSQTQWFTNKLTDPSNGYGTLYGQALDQAKKYFGGSNAFEAGTKFLGAIDPTKKPKPGTLSGMMNDMSGYNQIEREQLADGVFAALKENPVYAQQLFSRGNDQTFSYLQHALSEGNASLGADRLNQLKTHMDVENVMNAVKPLSVPAAGGHGNGFTMGAIGASVMEHGSILGAVHAIPVIVGHLAAKAGWNGYQAGRAKQLLQFAMNSSDPAVQKQLEDAISKAPGDRKIMSYIASHLPNAVAGQVDTHQINNANRPFQYARGGTPDRGNGASKMDHEKEADRLIALADKAKKRHNSVTKPLLNVDDNTVARALEVAKQHI